MTTETTAETQQTPQTLNGTLVCAIGTEIQQSLPTYEELQQRIRDRAYELWEKAGCPDGHETVFWLQAEKELFSVNDSSGEGYKVYVRDLDDPTVSENPESWAIQVIAPPQPEQCENSKTTETTAQTV